MQIFLKVVLYYVVTSIIAGFVMGLGFATNLGRKAGKAQLETLQKMGALVPLNLDGIEGALVAAPNLRRPTIVYVHGRSANRTELLPLAEAMFRHGYNAVLWDSKSRQIDYGPREIENIRKVVVWVRTNSQVDPERIYLVGFSLGAAMSIGAAAADPERHIRAIVADSPYANLKKVAEHYVTAFGVVPPAVAWPSKTVAFATAKGIHGIDFESRNPADWAERVSCPVFLIHGKSDWRIPPESSEEILSRLPAEKELWLVNDAGHTGAFSSQPAEYIERLLRFLR